YLSIPIAIHYELRRRSMGLTRTTDRLQARARSASARTPNARVKDQMVLRAGCHLPVGRGTQLARHRLSHGKAVLALDGRLGSEYHVGRANDPQIELAIAGVNRLHLIGAIANRKHLR